MVVEDASPAETLDKFVRGLQPSIREMVLMFNPGTFKEAALSAEHAAGIRRTYGPTIAPAIPSPQRGTVPLELGSAEQASERTSGSLAVASGRGP